MLQIARLASKQLGESRDLVAAFLRERVNPDGGFQDRAGASDLYYTVFGLDALVALQEEPPVQQTGAFLDRFGDGDGLDLVHLACLARGWATLRRPRDGAWADRFLGRLDRHRSDDGGYATTAAAADGNAYAAFLALGAYQDVGRELPDGEAVLASLSRLRAADG